MVGGIEHLRLFSVDGERMTDRGLATGQLRRVLVVGSRSPWVEACLLAASTTAGGAAGGAASSLEVVTMEYGPLRFDHPALHAVTPSQLRAVLLRLPSDTGGGGADGVDDALRFLREGRGVGRFDAVVSYSSVEHSGLGR